MLKNYLVIKVSSEKIKDEDMYHVVRPPHIYMGFEKNELMLKTFLLMGIIAIVSVLIMGLDALIHIITALGVVFLFHSIVYLYQRWKDKSITYETPSSPMVAGLIVGLSMPIAGPFYITALVALLMISIFKYGQGKIFKRKYLNPAAASKTILLLLLSVMIFFEDSLAKGLILHPHHLGLNLLTAEGFNNAMWIFDGKIIPLLGIELTAAQGLIFWQTHGWIGGASGITVLIIGSIAAYWLRYKWRIIFAGISTMTLLAVGIGLIVGPDPFSRIAFHIFTGSFIFMIFFMATEPQSTPMPERSQYIFGITLAILTFLLQ
ncbi:MAG: RnfABCDGE type electron transport complex subunit D, partial [Promethearchaeati archaeon]